MRARCVYLGWNALTALMAPILAIFLLLSWTKVAMAEGEAETVEQFIGICALSMPEIRRIEAAASELKWKPLSPTQATMLRPIDPNAKFSGWLVPNSGKPYLIGVWEGQLDGDKVLVCTHASTHFDPSELVSEMAKKLSLKTLTDETEAGQRYRTWTTNVNGISMLINLTTMQNQRQTGGSLSVFVKSK